MRILVESYGCTLNRGEAGEFIQGIAGKGHVLAESQEEADAYAIFTCGVIETTERHMLKRIGEFAREPEKLLLVCGCLSKICPEEIMAIAPHAILFGPAEQYAAIEFLESAGKPVQTTGRDAVGILPIATGCRGSCTYCITKNARGALASRTPAELRERLGRLVGAGSAEIQLCAQDAAVYGADLGIGLDTLIETLAGVEGDFMMRIGMMNPAGAKTNLEKILAAYDSPKVFKFLHLPVQSGSDAVLERMGRRHTAADFLSTVEEFRHRFPGMTLSTDIIVGFPGETDGEFEKSMELVTRAKPDIINITRFSARPGTEAHSMRTKVPGWKAKDRSRQLTDLRFGLTGENYMDLRGRTVRALATERRIPGTTFLRTPEYKPVVVDGEHELGIWYDITVTGKAKTHLIGHLESVK